MLLISVTVVHSFQMDNIRTIRRSSTIRRVIKDILTQQEFDEVTKNNMLDYPIVIDFQKSQCRPCKRIAPAYEALSAKYKEKVLFYKVDADSSKEALALMRANGVRSVPTFHIWRKGELVDTVQGARMEEVEQSIQDELKKEL